MEKNMSKNEQIARTVLGLAILGGTYYAQIAAPASYIAYAIGAIALITGLAGYCPIYKFIKK